MASSDADYREGLDVASIITRLYPKKPPSHPTSDENAFWRELPTKPLNSTDAVLYVSQGEFAVVDPDSRGNIQVIAADRATTCHIAVLLHPDLKVIGLAHFDDSGVEQGVYDLLQLMEVRCQVVSQSSCDSNHHVPNQLDLYIFGGFLDSCGHSQKLSQKLLGCFTSSDSFVNMKTVCIGYSNTQLRNNICYPVVTGIGVNCETLEIMKAKCINPDPGIQVRSCRNFVGSRSEMICAYDNEKKEVVIEPFDFKPVPNIDLWLQQSDDFLLQHMSTSPEQEEDDFVTYLRLTLQCIRDHQNQPLVTLFKDGKALRYILSPKDGWVNVVF